MDGVAPHLPHTHPAGEVLYIHSASDAAIAFSRGATPCAKSIPKQAGQTEAHPATRPPTRIRRPRAATHAHMCAHPSRPKRDRRRPPRPIRSAKLRKSRRYHSAHTWQIEGWHGGRETFRAHRNPRRRGHGGRASPRCGRTLPCRPPNRGRVVSVRRNRNPGTSTTHERKRVCRWEAHQSLAPAGQCDAPRRIKRARPGGEAAATSSPKAVLAGELGLPS